jgi:hypothetical protein
VNIVTVRYSPCEAQYRLTVNDTTADVLSVLQRKGRGFRVLTFCGDIELQDSATSRYDGQRVRIRHLQTIADKLNLNSQGKENARH